MVGDADRRHSPGDGAKGNVEDVLGVHPRPRRVVGLFAYNPPRASKGSERRASSARSQCVGFDEQSATLQAIKDGTCFGTVVQNPTCTATSPSACWRPWPRA